MNDPTHDHLKRIGAISAEGLSGLASMAATDLRLGQGHGELPETNRHPIHPGHEGTRDDLPGADYIKDF